MYIQTQAPNDVPRIMLLVIIIGLLLVGSFWTLLPFLGGLAWATMIVVATWPILLLVQRHVGGRRSIAVCIMTVIALAAFIAPLFAAITTLLDAADRSPAVLGSFIERGLAPPPAWVDDIPGVGDRVAERWAGWGSVLLIWSVPVIALDNVLRPILIRRGVQLPMLLIIAGVIGGLIGFGVIGLFVGPVILAATYTLALAWIAEVGRPAIAEPSLAASAAVGAPPGGTMGAPLGAPHP